MVAAVADTEASNTRISNAEISPAPRGRRSMKYTLESVNLSCSMEYALESAYLPYIRGRRSARPNLERHQLFAQQLLD